MFSHQPVSVTGLALHRMVLQFERTSRGLVPRGRRGSYGKYDTMNINGFSPRCRGGNSADGVRSLPGIFRLAVIVLYIERDIGRANGHRLPIAPFLIASSAQRSPDSIFRLHCPYPIIGHPRASSMNSPRVVAQPDQSTGSGCYCNVGASARICVRLSL